jgi:hypothetical protein
MIGQEGVARLDTFVPALALLFIFYLTLRIQASEMQAMAFLETQHSDQLFSTWSFQIDLELREQGPKLWGEYKAEAPMPLSLVGNEWLHSSDR